MQYTVKYTLDAKYDLKVIMEFLISKDLAAAGEFLEWLSEAEAQLKKPPCLAVVPSNEVLAHRGYRLVNMGNYLLFCVIGEDTVEIHRVIHSSRRYEFLTE